jgi:hypothetical protein
VRQGEAGGVEVVVGDHARHDPVAQRLLRVEHAAREREVGRESVPGDLEQSRRPAGVGHHAVLDLRQPHARALARDPHVAQERALERAADHPALQRHDDRRRDREELLRAGVAALDEVEVADVLGAHAELRGVAPRRERLAVATPHDRAHVVAAVELGERSPELCVHRVVGGVVLVGPVVAEHGHRAVVFERD